MKNFVCFLITAVFTGSLLASLPDDKIPSVNEQIEHYRKAYTPFNHKEFDPEKTHIEDLVPMVRIAHSYAVQGIPQNDERFEILRSLWKETEQQIEKKNITVSYFLKMNMRLAFLFSHNQKMSLISDQSPLLKGIKESPNKWDLMNYKELDADPFPFCFQAILYHAEEIPVRTFLDNYLDTEFPMGLSTLSHYVGSEFEDEQPDPASFLMLDLFKFEHIRHASGKDGIYWPDLRNIFRKIYISDNGSFATTGLFLYLNESLMHYGELLLEPKRILGRAWDLDKKLENDLPENLPFCERLQFKRLLWAGEEMLNRQSDPLHLQLYKIFNSLKSEKYPHLELDSINIQKIGRDTFKTELKLGLLIPNSLFTDWEETTGDTTLILNLGGELKSILKVESTNNPNREKISFKDVTFEEKSDLEEFQGHQRGGVNSEEHLMMISNYYQIPYTIENVKNEAMEFLKDKEEVTYSRKLIFNITTLDICNLLNVLNNTDKLSYESSMEEIKESYQTFINLFYSKYKDLFSTEEIKVLEDK